MCGIAFIRLRKPFEYYREKYGTYTYGLDKLYLLMEKQHNRGQDGAGIVSINIHAKPGSKYIHRRRSVSSNYIEEIFNNVYNRFRKAEKKNKKKFQDPDWTYHNVSYTGEVLLGHLRYGTHGKNTIHTCHPFMRQNNWRTRNLVAAGNFNLTNVDQLFEQLMELGQHPKEKTDTVTILEKIGHFLDSENQQLFEKYKSEKLPNTEISEKIADNLNIPWILQKSLKDFDGGYALCGMFGHGDAFVVRDPSGIRPAYYYADDEIVVAASERAAIQTAFDLSVQEVKEIPRAHALIVKRDGSYSVDEIIQPLERMSCSFERIYFSRGTDADIYKERKDLGRALTERVLEAVNYDLENSVFSYIPNTAETSFYGLVKGIERYLDQSKRDRIKELNGELTAEALDDILSVKPRVEKIAVKDAKLRTFITDDSTRDEMVSHVYDITYGVVKEKVDNLVVIDDSIVRGTTLKKSILSILDRLEPKKIIVVSSAPQIRYPDCYGIDMSKLGDFVAFRAMEACLKDDGKTDLMTKALEKCRSENAKEGDQIENGVKMLYDQIPTERLSKKIGEIVTSRSIEAEVEVIYQTIEDLHRCCPDHLGDWYFSGNYPTPGGARVVNRSFIFYMEGRNERAY